jgi:4,5-dihydroxyphthalate decarboxylase
MRGLRHRCFFVRQDSGMNAFHHLTGKRVGTNGWPDTGNTWSRAALREQGVSIDEIEWRVGPVDDPTYDSFGKRPEVALPPNVQPVEPGRTLQEMLLAGELDAMMCPWPPKRFSQPDSPIVRLFQNYRTVERDYAERVGFYPGFHLLAVRRPILERDPWLAQALFEAFERSRLKAEANRRWLADTSPWFLADLEIAESVLGTHWQAHGLEPNRKMIQTLCQEEYAQGLISEPLDCTTVFPDFEEMTRGDTYA